ncbi:MAG: Rieske 2Fe-2S domain-containing protein, partial [Chloroflexota bacterium]
IGDRCPHRKVNMLYGIPEQEGLRCPYHGWLFNHEGQCIEQPYEQAEDPNSNFKDKIHIQSYPVQELCGLIFAYLGPQPAPLLPRWDLFTWDNVMWDIGATVIPCNWLQCMENSLDPVHVEWLHVAFSNYVLERLGRPDLKRQMYLRGETTSSGWQHEKIGFDVFEHGIIKRRVVAGQTEENVEWRIGHPVVFPNILRVQSAFQYRVPIDDENTLHVYFTAHIFPPGMAEKQASIPFYEVPMPKNDNYGEIPWNLLDNNSGQDMWAWFSQGRIADRTTEHLGLSDKGVILYRRLLRDQLAKLQRGEETMNVFRNPTKNNRIDLPWEGQEGGERFTVLGNRRTGQAQKYSPVLRDFVAKRDGQAALEQPVH